MGIGDAITAGFVYVGMNVGMMIAAWVWMGLTCDVIVATEPIRYWSVVFWFGELDMPGRLQAERTATSERYTDSNLNVFNFSFVIA